MPIGAKFSAKQNQEALFPVSLRNCHACKPTQLAHCTDLGEIFTRKRSREFQASAGSTEFAAASGGKASSRILMVDGGVRPAIASKSKTGAEIISFEKFLSDPSVNACNSPEIPEAAVTEEVMEAFLAKYGKVDSIIFDNSTKCQHPYHISNVTSVQSNFLRNSVHRIF